MRPANTLAEYPSKSDPSKMYHIIKAQDGSVYCDCWNWKMKKNCSHLMDYCRGGQEFPTQPEPPDKMARAVGDALAWLNQN